MSITHYKTMTAMKPGQLAAAVAGELGTWAPVGSPYKNPDGHLCQVMAQGDDAPSMDEYMILQAKKPALLDALVTDAIGDSFDTLIGGPFLDTDGNICQAVATASSE